MRQILFALMIGTVSLSVVACDEKLSTIAGPTPDLQPTFASIQRDIFEAADSSGRKNCTACHSSIGRTPSGGMSLDHDVAYDSIVNGMSSRKPGSIRIVPGDPDGSYLVHKVEGASDIVGVRMPQGGPYLSPGQITILRRWIEIGAPRN